MKKIWIIIIVLLISSFLYCQEKKEETLTPLTKEEISLERLWTRITEESNYKTYVYWPNHEGFQRGQSPHGSFHKIFINNTLCNDIPSEDNLLPSGSIIVKENFNSQKELYSYTVMAKVEDYDPDTNNWFWAKYDQDGKPTASGPEGKEGLITPCIECHSGKKNNDYIIIHPINKPLE